MYVRRPYVDGLLTLWLGFSLGASDGNFDRFCLWVQSERFPATGGHRNALAVDSILRRAVAGNADVVFTEDHDDEAVALLRRLLEEFELSNCANT